MRSIPTCAALLALATAVFSALPVPLHAQPPAPSAAAVADTPQRTAAGHAYLVPAGWTQRRRDGVVVLETPERDAWVTLVDVEADDARLAVERAWRAHAGVAPPEPLLSTPVADRQGWRDGRSFAYRHAGDPSRQLGALAMRHDARWLVWIGDLASGVGSRRGHDLGRIRDALVPAGVARESFAGRRAHRLDRARIAALTAFIEDARTQLDVPGISIGIVQDGATVFAGGFGVREAGGRDPVDADTLYLIASSTKPLTSLMLATLVDEGRFDWETPVVALLPRFRLADAELTPQVTVRHLLCACAGLPYRNLDWEFAPADADASIALDILARMRPTSAFGTSYRYSNPPAAAAGLVGGHVAHPGLPLGAAYDTAMQRRVFDPLGMRRTTFDFDQAMQGNYARSHGVASDGTLEPIVPSRDRRIHAVRPAGGAWSNVDDLLAYLRMELRGGLRDDGGRYVSAQALQARWAPQVATAAHAWYGMGLDTDTSSGIRMLSHGGRLYGVRGNVVWWPEHGVGAVILMNASSGNVLMDAFPRRLMELLFDGRPEAGSMVTAAAASAAEQRAVSRRTLRLPADPAHAAMLAPRYRNDLLGDIHVRGDAAGTHFDFGSWDAPVASRVTGDGRIEFVAAVASAPPAFVAGEDGAGRRTLTLRDAQNVYVFVEAE